MQPYFFPYIGYYQLAHEVENFVFLDDVNLIKKGYINRNSILLQGRPHRFTIPVAQPSQNKQINTHDYVGDFSSFLALITHAYKSSRHYRHVMPLIESTLIGGDLNVARINANSVVSVFNYLGLQRDFSFSSDLQLDPSVKRQHRILAICQKLGIEQYRNAVGGKSLYDPQTFEDAGVQIKFLQSHLNPYGQGNCAFIPSLSMIDVLMHCDKEEIIGLLKEYSLD